MTSTELQTQTHDAELLPTPDVTDDGLALLQRQAEAMGAAHKIATVLSGTGMVPQAYRGKPDDAAAAILYGAEVGLKPQQALQQVFVVHGQPSIYARTMVALLKAKGYRFETIESTDQAVTVRGTSPRGEVEESTWTVDRAKTAGYTSNKKYATDPQAMLYAKAASEVSRKLAPDVLLGIKYAAEDLELEQQPVRATAERTDRRGGQSALERAKKKPAPEEKADPSQQALEGIGRCQDADQLDQMLNWATNQGMSEAQLDALKDAAAARADELGLVTEGEQA
ncbi:hypothetical protein [Corynebacterium sp. AOP34-BR1-29]|uniref:hypothetical protein n=1 Tax=Corynebacterium sp. AOP34-BR1-29 TaxID=3457688 RepID=UPI0040346B70